MKIYKESVFDVIEECYVNVGYVTQDQGQSSWNGYVNDECIGTWDSGEDAREAVRRWATGKDLGLLATSALIDS